MLFVLLKIKMLEKAIKNEIALQKEAEMTRLARIEALKAMIPKKEAMWEAAAKHLENTYASAYDAATRTIAELKEVAVFENKLSDFEEQLDLFVANYIRRPAFIRRLRDRGILKIKG